MPDTTGVLALVSDDWAVAPQRRHHVLTRLSARCPVAWISPALHWRAPRSEPKPEHEHPVDSSRLFVLRSSAGVPTVNAPRAVHNAVYKRRVLRGVRWLRERGCRRIELQVWNPDFAGALDWVPRASTSYHIDDEYSWSTVERPLSATERALIARVDRVYVTSPKLLETKGGVNPRTIVSPNGADYRAFSTPTAEPADLASIPRPRVGYVGVLKEQLDLELIIGLVKRHASWSFVFVGPVRTVHTSVHAPLAELVALPNVHLLGERSAAALPAYLQHVDVALLPYRRDAYTDCINPMKLYEALAAGTPVVGSRIRTLDDFRSVVSLPNGVDEWSRAIAEAVAHDSVERRAARQAIAKQFDWDVIVAGMASGLRLS